MGKRAFKMQEDTFKILKYDGENADSVQKFVGNGRRVHEYVGTNILVIEKLDDNNYPLPLEPGNYIIKYADSTAVAVSKTEDFGQVLEAYKKSDHSNYKKIIGLTFEEAISRLRGGAKVRRKSWAKEYDVTLSEKNGTPEFVCLDLQYRKMRGWYPNQKDMFAEDWEIIEE
jgi:hypothetical protein